MAGVGFETIHAVAPPPVSRTPTPRTSASLRIPSPPGGSADGGYGGSKKVIGWSSSGCLSRCGARLGSSGLTVPRIRVLRVRAGRESTRCKDGDGTHGLEKEEEEEQQSTPRLIRTLLIDNYDSYTYNICQELTVVNGQPPIVVYNDEWTWDYARQCLHEAAAFDNIVISPGPGSPTCPKDIGICLKILLECKDIPILGVCLGHQALGYVHGARITHAPEPIHGRLSEIEHTGCDLFLDIPSGSESGFKVVRYHSLIIDGDSLPKELIPIAWATLGHAHSLFQTKESDTMPIFLSNKRTLALCTDYFSRSVDTLSNKVSMEKNLMGIRHSARPHYGVQFHPESVATSYGRQIFENFKKITIDHGLRSSALPYTKVALGYQLPKGRNRLKLLANNLDMGQQTDANRSSKSKDVKHLKLQWRKLDGMARQVGGSRDIFSELFGDQNAEDTFWLDSSSTEQRRARFSFMGGKGGPLWKQITFWLSDQSNRTAGGGYLSTRDVTGKKTIKFLNDGFLNFMDKELKSFHYDKEDYEALPFNFCGGFVGFLGYGLKVECGASSNSYKSATPDACFFFADNLIVIDHNNDDVYILCIQDARRPIFEAAQCNASRTWMDETEKKLLGLISSRVKMSDQRKSSTRLFNVKASKFIVAKTRYQYMKDVESCQKLIRDGESYELCLTTQMRKKVKDIHAIRVYYSLRESNPAPYAAWLNFSSENLCILCSSPERFLQLDRNGILEAKPIKGTIARGATLEEDSHLKFQLQNSEKDQAENLMIVDLLRNDLGRVCEPGTVHVPDLMKVESYATVHTMVSTIQGKKMSDLSPMDCVRAAFPGGSMTGAPKLRSMEILDKLECCSRGIYSGSIGFFSYNQRFDLNIVIRTVVIHEGEASIGAGGAVVALSNPSEEYEEMLLKARAPASAVEYSGGGSESNLTSSSSHCGTYG